VQMGAAQISRSMAQFFQRIVAAVSRQIVLG